jgi:NAD(P)-dependent dehydrogenase (short-subunit alcohol dehydrogenase family)
MKIRDENVMVLGGYGEVGNAVCRQLLPHKPKRLVITSLRKDEARHAVEELRKAPSGDSCEIIPFHGNLFVRWGLKDMTMSDISAKLGSLRLVVDDNLAELNKDILASSTLYRLIVEYRPAIIVDCITTATGLAYRNAYHQYEQFRASIASGGAPDHHADSAYRIFFTMSVPALIRHTQILQEAMKRAQTQLYLKVGTTGTGGMGLNIPFTHGEENPSRLLITKAAVAGAQTMLLFALSRTPGGPIIKEIKPAALIGWKGVGRGTIKKAGRPVKLYDCVPENAYRLVSGTPFRYIPETDMEHPSHGDELEGVYIDTGENGVFSPDEFKIITSLGLMEFVTPEEVAQTAILTIRGVSSSKDVLGALDGAVTGPSYRGGFLREFVLKRAASLGTGSPSYGLIGPRVSKLILEATLLRFTFHTMEDTIKAPPSVVACTLKEHLAKDRGTRQSALSIGIPILLPDGERLLFVRRKVKDKAWEEEPWIINQDNIERWASREWIDLRVGNMSRWQDRFRKMLREINEGAKDTSSRFDRENGFRFRDGTGKTMIDAGEVAAWVLIHEFGGGRIQAYTETGDRYAEPA